MSETMGELSKRLGPPRYMVFSGEWYYPAGGAKDLVGIYSTVEAAKEAVVLTEYEWFHIYDLQERRIVFHKHARNR